MLFGLLLYSGLANFDPNKDSPNQVLGRVIYWIGATSQLILSVVLIAEWIGRRLTIEHINPHWFLLPIGLSIAAFSTPLVGPVSFDVKAAVGNPWIGRFYASFANVLYITLFTITFFKAITGHNSKFRDRYAYFYWIAASASIGLAEYAICRNSQKNTVVNIERDGPSFRQSLALTCGDDACKSLSSPNASEHFA
jgi:tellurite resistance protein TehA-like permease